MEEEYLPPADVEHRARSCIQANNLRIADERIAALVELVKALRVKFIKSTGLVLGWMGISGKF